MLARKINFLNIPSIYFFLSFFLFNFFFKIKTLNFKKNYILFLFNFRQKWNKNKITFNSNFFFYKPQLIKSFKQLSFLQFKLKSVFFFNLINVNYLIKISTLNYKNTFFNFFLKIQKLKISFLIFVYKHNYLISYFFFLINNFSFIYLNFLVFRKKSNLHLLSIYHNKSLFNFNVKFL